MRKNKKLAIFILLDVCIILALVAYFVFFRPPMTVKIHGTYMETPSEIADFSLIDTRDHSFTKNNLKNHWTFVFFGFTQCPMVCPTTMQVLNQTYRLLEKRLPKEFLPQVVFISIDPERDTLDKIKTFLNAFNKNFIGVRADSNEITQLQKQFHVIADRVNQNKDYTINHSMEIILVDPDAQIRAYFTYPPQAEQLVADYLAIITPHSSHFARRPLLPEER